MTLIKKLCLNALLLTAVAACTNVFADDVMDADDFVEEASAKGLAEIESSKLALEKTRNLEVRKFAQTMIEDHTKANQELKKISSTKKLDVSDDPELMSQAKAMILKVRDGESFDEAYANNQVMAHKQTIDLFEKAATVKDAELKAFVQKTLPKLRHHLDMAQTLQTKILKMQSKEEVERDGKTGTSANTGERTDGAGRGVGDRVGGPGYPNDTTTD